MRTCNIMSFICLNFVFLFKDFVKIAKWNDSNFWAMKQAADKSHHTLHKFVRKYEVREQFCNWRRWFVTQI